MVQAHRADLAEGALRAGAGTAGWAVGAAMGVMGMDLAMAMG